MCLLPTKVRRGYSAPGTRIYMVVSHLVGAGIGTRVVCKNNKYSSHWVTITIFFFLKYFNFILLKMEFVCILDNRDTKGCH